MTFQYRERPKEVEAKLFDGTQQYMMDVLTWVQENGYTLFDMFTPAPANGVTIDVASGSMQLVNTDGYSQKTTSFVRRGDYVVKDALGKMRGMRPEEFEALYDPIIEEEEGVIDNAPQVEFPSGE